MQRSIEMPWIGRAIDRKSIVSNIAAKKTKKQTYPIQIPNHRLMAAGGQRDGAVGEKRKRNKKASQQGNDAIQGGHEVCASFWSDRNENATTTGLL
jgi:hypothetical protein